MKFANNNKTHISFHNVVNKKKVVVSTKFLGLKIDSNSHVK